MKRFFKGMAVTGLCLAGGIFGIILYGDKNLPDSFRVTEGQVLSSPVYRLPVTAGRKPSRDAVPAAGSESVGSEYEVSLNLFGVIPLKDASVEVVDKSYVVPAGTPFGIKIFTEGVLVVGLTDVDTAAGMTNPAKKAGLKEGDVILSIDNEPVNDNERVADLISGSRGRELKLRIRRKNLTFDVVLKPEISMTDGKYKAGMWIRDSSAGIGTLTFYSPADGTFGGLGHAICDVDTGEILPLMTGDIVAAEIVGIVKGKNGAPGELRGRFVDDRSVGTIHHNGETGIYGSLKHAHASQNMVEVAMKQQVREGPAELLTTVAGTEPARYECRILKVNWNDDSPTQNMVIEITDPVLLEKTGGIVQGMSGSPILQDGRLIGAVTHVFVNNSKKGYAIFAENMKRSAETVQNRLKKAS